MTATMTANPFLRHPRNPAPKDDSFAPVHAAAPPGSPDDNRFTMTACGIVLADLYNWSNPEQPFGLWSSAGQGIDCPDCLAAGW